MRGPRIAVLLLLLVIGRRSRQELPPAFFGNVCGCRRLQEVPPRQEMPGAFEDLEAGAGNGLGCPVGVGNRDDG